MSQAVPVVLFFRAKPEALYRRFIDANAYPRHAVIGISDARGPAVAYIHTQGSSVIWSAPIRQLVLNGRFVRGLSPEDALEMGFWAGMAATTPPPHS